MPFFEDQTNAPDPDQPDLAKQLETRSSRDPLERAARPARRVEKKQDSTKSEKVNTPDPDQEGHARQRPTVPSAVRHHVWMRDQGRCTWCHPDGQRCLTQ